MRRSSGVFCSVWRQWRVSAVIIIVCFKCEKRSMDPGVKELCSTDFPLRQWLCGCESLQDRITDNKQIMWSLHRTETRTTAFTLSSFILFCFVDVDPETPEQPVPLCETSPRPKSSPEASMNRSWKATPQVQSQVPTSPTLRSLFCILRPMSRSKSRPTSPKWRAKSFPEFRA